MKASNMSPDSFVSNGVIDQKDVGKVCQVGMDLKVSHIECLDDDNSALSTDDNGDALLLKGNAYSLTLCRVNMPLDCYGYVVGRSTFNRQGVLIRSSIIDGGYQGMLGVTAYAMGKTVSLPLGTRVGQLLLWSANSCGAYKGKYQNEGLNK